MKEVLLLWLGPECRASRIEWQDKGRETTMELQEVAWQGVAAWPLNIIVAGGAERPAVAANAAWRYTYALSPL